MILPLPRTGPSRRCRLQLITKIRLSSFSRERQGNRAEGLRLVQFAVPKKCPDLHSAGFHQAAIFQIAVEARLIDGHDGRQPHRNRRKLPELRHEIGVRVRGQAFFLLKFPAKIFQMLFGDAAFQKCPRIDAGRRVPLEIDDVAVMIGGFGVKKVIETDFIQGRAGCIG